MVGWICVLGTLATLSIVCGEELSGFIDMTGSRPGVRKGSQLFYWFTPAQDASASAPLLIWLQGGPGSEGELGLFFEIGPYYLNEDLTLVNRTVGNWNKHFNVLFLDQPIGTGYSTAGSDSSYATNEDDVANDLYFFLLKWYALYGQYSSSPLFLTGESYAGHYIPAFGHKILTENDKVEQSGNPLVNLQGVAIGDGLTDPCSQVEAGPRAAFDFGLINPKTFALAKDIALKASMACVKGDWTAAHDYREQMESTVLDASGINKYDVRTFEGYDSTFDRMDVYLNQPKAKEMLHVPLNVPFQTDELVRTKLYDDVMQSQKDKFPLLLERVRVLLYQGQFDWKDGPFSNEKWLERIDWPGKREYLAAERKKWHIVTGEATTSLAGWIQTYGALSEVIVNAAGHLAPMDQPERLFQMISTFVQNDEFLTA